MARHGQRRRAASRASRRARPWNFDPVVDLDRALRHVRDIRATILADMSRNDPLARRIRVERACARRADWPWAWAWTALTPFGLSRRNAGIIGRFWRRPGLASSSATPAVSAATCAAHVWISTSFFMREQRKVGSGGRRPVNSSSPPSRHLFPISESIRRTCHTKSAGG